MTSHGTRPRASISSRSILRRMPAIRACLEHRHSYVRRNAVLAVFTIFKQFDFLIPDAPEMMLAFLEAEQVRI